MPLVSITIGILASYWIDYGSNYIGGTRCAPNIPYTGGTADAPAFDPYNDVGPGGCDGQSEAAWRLPFAFQIFPAIILGIGMIFFPDSPRWLLMKDRDDDALATLAKLRRLPIDNPLLSTEYLEIKASVLLENSFTAENHPGLSGIKLHAAQVGHDPLSYIARMLRLSQYFSLISTWSKFKRLGIGCAVMFFQQFMGCNGRHLSMSPYVRLACRYPS